MQTFFKCCDMMKKAYTEMELDHETYLRNFSNFFCKMCNSTCVSAWNSTVAYNYFRDDLDNLGKYWNRNPKKEENGSDYFRPNSNIWDTFMEEANNLVQLLDFCTEQFNDITPPELKKAIYSNMAYFTEVPIGQCSYKAMVHTTTNGYGAVIRRREYYEIDYFLSDSAKSSRRAKIKKYKELESVALAEVESRKEEERRKKEEERKQKIAAYWEAHAEEKVALESEKEELTAQVDSIRADAQMQIQTLNKEKESISGADELTQLSGEIRELYKRMDSLAFFKRKEKQAIQQRIKEIEQVKLNKTNEREVLCAEVQKRIDTLSSDFALQISQLNQRIKEINRELTKDVATQFDLFLSQASTCTRIVEIHNMWKSFTWDESLTSTIGKKISESAQIERMYGSNPGSLNKLIEDLRKMI